MRRFLKILRTHASTHLQLLEAPTLINIIPACVVGTLQAPSAAAAASGSPAAAVGREPLLQQPGPGGEGGM